MCEPYYDYGPVPFRFFHYWFDMEGFDKLVGESWKAAPMADTNAKIKMMKKLKYLKEKICVWNKTNKEGTGNNMRKLKADFAELDVVIDKGEGDEDVVNKRTNVVRSLREFENLQSIWRDEMSTERKIVTTDGESTRKRQQQSRESRERRVDMNFLNILNSDQQADLECEVTKDEIKRAVWDCGIDKSPSLDGFTFGFHPRYWKIIESDVVDATHDANMVKDFRPISLIGSLYKIIAKLLVNRLVVVLGSLVNEVQSAFVADRQILDGPFILNENLRMGDLLSLFLFILVMESLYVSFQRVMDACQWNESNINTIVHVLDCFHRASGLRINMSKRSKVGGLMSRIQSWNETVEGMANRLSRWKMKSLSIGEKVEVTLLANMRDRWTWSLEGSGDFSVTSVRKLLDKNILPEVASKTRLIKAMPIKVNVHAWRVKLGCLPARINISHRGMEIESIICPMCGEAAESSRHIFFSCRIAREILSKISRWWDVSYMELSSYEEWLDWILNIRVSVKHKQILEGVCYAMWWLICNFQNKCIFDSESPFKAIIFEDVVSRSFYWCRYRCKGSFSWIQWLKNPHLLSF
ncbi:RNA-directed DNA polymerase, eukaryota [Tanacetum coccineum]